MIVCSERNVNSEDSLAAWSNAVNCVIVDDFIRDLSKVVTNDDSEEGAIRWLLTFVSGFLRDHKQAHGPMVSFDFAIIDIESIGRCWGVVAKTMELHSNSDQIVRGQLARFLVERLPAVWESAPFLPHPPVTQALVMADRIDTLVGFFLIGLKPNGSKDPFALRRAAKHFLHQIIFPMTVGSKIA